MTDSYKLITTRKTYELVYGGSQTDYNIVVPVALTGGMPDVSLHNPDSSKAQPIRARNVLRSLSAEVIVYGDDWNDALNDIAALKRSLAGADSEATQYSVEGEGDPVVFRVQLSGSTNYTDHDVLWGYVDDSVAIHRVRDQKTAWLVPIQLQLDEAGYGEIFTLRNELTGSPGMLLPGSTAGLAAGLTLVGSPTAYTLDITRGILGQSQKMTVDNAGTDGFDTDTIPSARGTAAAAYAWINQDSGNKITVTLMDGSSNVIEAKEFSNADPTANADFTAVDHNGHTWYRIRVEGVNAAAHSFKLRVARDTSDAASATTWWTCCLYLQTTDSLNLIKYPNMDIDSDSDGVVDGWGWGGAATKSVSNVHYFSSAYSQSIGDGAGTTKLVSDPVAVNPGATINLSAWVKPDGGATTVMSIVVDDDDATILASVNLPNPASGYDTSQVGDDTDTWYKYSVSYTPVAPTRELTVRVQFKGTANQTYIDNVSLWQGAGESDLCTVRAWISPWQPYNRHNPTASNPERINTIDVWGIHGDMPAAMTAKINIGGADKQRYYISRWIDGTYRAIDRLHVLAAYQSGSDDWQPDGSPTASNGTWSNPTDTATNTGTTLRFTASGAGGSGTYELTSNTYPHTIERLLASVRRAFLQVKASSTSIVMTVTIKAGPSGNQITLLSSGDKSVGTTGQLQLIDIGVSNGLGLLSRAKKKWSLGANYSVTFTVNGVPNAATIDFDCIWLLPVDESGEFMMLQTQEDSATVGRSFLWLFGEEEAASLQGQIEEPNTAGTMYRLAPGVVNRLAFLQTESNNETDITDYLRATLYVMPRASHLLGTE